MLRGSTGGYICWAAENYFSAIGIHITAILSACIRDMSNLAHTMIMEHKYEEAVEWLHRYIELKTRLLGPDHPFTRADRTALERAEAEFADM